MEHKAEIDDLTRRFYALFSNRHGAAVHLSAIYELFIQQGLIVKTCGDVPEVYDLQDFIEPRERLLSNGELVDFQEEEVREQTLIAGCIAQRFSHYAKSGVLRGVRFETIGVKTMQFIRANGNWRIMSVAWDDEREGFSIEREE